MNNIRLRKAQHFWEEISMKSPFPILPLRRIDSEFQLVIFTFQESKKIASKPLIWSLIISNKATVIVNFKEDTFFSIFSFPRCWNVYFSTKLIASYKLRAPFPSFLHNFPSGILSNWFKMGRKALFIFIFYLRKSSYRAVFSTSLAEEPSSMIKSISLQEMKHFFYPSLLNPLHLFAFPKVHFFIFDITLIVIIFDFIPELDLK